MMKHDAIYSLYPQTVIIQGETAFDEHGEKVNYDEKLINEYIELFSYRAKRQAEYPPITDYLDAIVKNDQEAISKYIETCREIKVKYPKPVN